VEVQKNTPEMALNPQILRKAAEDLTKQAAWLRHTARSISLTAPADPGPPAFLAAAEHLERLANETLSFLASGTQTEAAREALEELQRDPVSRATMDSILNPGKTNA